MIVNWITQLRSAKIESHFNFPHPMRFLLLSFHIKFVNRVDIQVENRLDYVDLILVQPTYWLKYGRHLGLWPYLWRTGSYFVLASVVWWPSEVRLWDFIEWTIVVWSFLPISLATSFNVPYGRIVFASATRASTWTLVGCRIQLPTNSSLPP